MSFELGWFIGVVAHEEKSSSDPADQTIKRFPSI
jgi:hypothetical protein